MGPRAVFHQRSEESPKADQRQVGDGGNLRDVQGGFRKRRCLVPAPAYYEWRADSDGKTPFAVARVDGDPVVFAGIWEDWRLPNGEALHTFSTITTDANQQLAAIQDRMPVILEKADWPLWLGEVEGDVAALLRPLPEGMLRTWSVDKKINKVGNNGPQLLDQQQEAEPELPMLPAD
jgi:putative SOS response-associated peptidase YedK